MDEFLKSIPTIISTSGVAGVVLWYYLTRIVPSLDAFKNSVWTEIAAIRGDAKRMEEAMDRATKADLLRLIASPHVSDAVKDAAADVIKDVDEAKTKREAVAP